MSRWLWMIFAIAVSGLAGAGETDADYAENRLHPGAPAFTVQAREVKAKFDDCSECHEKGDTDPEPRKLRTRHVRKIDHGGNRFWCLTCHDGDNVKLLRTSSNEIVDFDQSYLICGSCHADRQKDWYYGGHGKRISGWQEQRVILACTHCHDPHEPAVKPRQPRPRPPVRIGLERQDHHPPANTRTWDRQVPQVEQARGQ